MAKIISKLQLIDEKLNELKATIAATKTDDSISKNTRSTKLYALSKERRILHLLRALIEQQPDIKLSEDDMNTFTLLTTLAEERVRYEAVVVNEGDKIQDVLETYKERKDIFKKLQAACEKAGLKMDFSTGTIIKA